MVLRLVDWLIISAFFAVSIVIGIITSRMAGKSYKSFFLSDRSMPWWLLGVSMVATTFSCDTPNLVTDIVRQHGVSGNWVWWAFLLTGMLTVFVYAKLWRRSKVLTDIEFYELRYSGKPAAFLRGFRSLYLGVFFNVIIMAAVSLAMIKIGAVMLQWPATTTLFVTLTVTVIYASLGGLRGILLTDFFQFTFMMIGAIGAAVILLKLPVIGGIQGLITNEAIIPKLNLLPDFANKETFFILLILPLAIQWWSVWYPGAEPGGGGYVAQRMLSAKTEKDAMKSAMLFNVLHYAIRPWPWILVGLASLVVFPDLASLRAAFPNIAPNIIKNDFAYPAMLSLLPTGFLGLVVASLIAAFMSTIASSLNMGSSYMVNDFYKRFINPEANEKKLVIAGRVSTVTLAVLTGMVALLLSNALQAFHILLQIGAGTGSIFILRWFWWRVNAWSEISAMTVSFLVALCFSFGPKLFGFPVLSTASQLIIGVTITTISWIVVTLLTKPDDMEKLRKFYSLVYPGGPGWKKVVESAGEGDTAINLVKSETWDVPAGILSMVLGCFCVYGFLFSVGYFIYGKVVLALVIIAMVIVCILIMKKTWKRLKMN